jgi:uncharacterized protein YbjT (DUF2867 family)
MKNRILVIGSTGKTGRKVYETLKQKHFDVTPASRKTQQPFDWYDSKTWENALKGFDTVYITFQPDLSIPESVPIITAFVETARRMEIGKLVLLSGRGEPQAMACEDVIINSGLAYTILKCSFFMQNFNEGFWADGIISGEFVVPFVSAKEPFLDTDDISEVAVQALTTTAHDSKIYDLTGPELLSFKEAIDTIAIHSGKEIKLIEVSIDEYTAALRGQIPEEFIAMIEHLFVEVLDGRNESVTTDIASILGKPATPFTGFAAKASKSGAWVTNQLAV